jgi:HEAT repeat protein
MLGWFDDPRVYDRVKQLVTDDYNDKARRECIKSLLWNDHPDQEELLVNALADPSKKVRRWAERYLKFLKQLKNLMIE